MAKRANTGRTATRGRPTNASRTASRSNASGTGRGRRPKSMNEYIDEDLGGDIDEDVDPAELVQEFEQAAEDYDVEQPRVVRRASRGDSRIGNNFGAANRGRGQNQFTRNDNPVGRGDGGYYTGGNYSQRGGRGNVQDLINGLRDLLDQFE